MDTPPLTRLRTGSHEKPLTDYCADCGAAVSARYCGACGLRFPTHRLSVGHILHEIPHAIFHVDRGVLPTLFLLGLRPGIAINAYLNGRRQRLTNPLTLLLLMAGLYALAYTLSSASDTAVTDTADTTKASLRLFSEYMLITLAVQLPVTALVTWGLFRSGGRTYGEHLAMHAYIFAFSCAMGVCLTGLRWVLEPRQFAIAFSAAIGAYQIWAVHAVFTSATRHRGLRLLKAALAVASYTALNTATLWAATGIYAVIKA